MARILGSSGFGRLAVGYPVNINDIDTKPFTVAADAPATGIAPGALLVKTSAPNVYTTVDPAGSAASYSADKMAGIALATNVKLDTVFPQSSGEVTWKRGQAGGVAVRGEIAVKLTGSAPAPGDAVYYDLAQQAFTKSSSSTIALTNMLFTGNTEGNVTVVNIRY